jgi:hypothetical protein
MNAEQRDKTSKTAFVMNILCKTKFRVNPNFVKSMCSNPTGGLDFGYSKFSIFKQNEPTVEFDNDEIYPVVAGPGEHYYDEPSWGLEPMEEIEVFKVTWEDQQEPISPNTSNPPPSNECFLPSNLFSVITL